MRTFISIDDTDNIDSRGTGELASLIAKKIEENGWGIAKGITRHQLFIHPDIPYTSHNSSMCFEADIAPVYIPTVIEFAKTFLEVESAEGSDPGLCVAVEDQIVDPKRMIDFGKSAKKVILTKEETYTLAKELGVHLSEHGGTGQGIIGALAGVGLRMTGNDGRYKGKIKLNSIDNRLTVSDILKQAPIDRVMELGGESLASEEVIHVGETVKAVLLDHKATLLVSSSIDERTGEKRWQACPNQQLKVY